MIEKLEKSTLGLFEHDLIGMFDKINELIETVNFLKNELAVHHNTLMLMSMDLQDIKKCQ